MNKTEYNEAHKLYVAALPSSKKSAHTVKSYDLALRKFGEYLNSVEQNGDILPINVVGFRTALYNTGIKSNTVKQYLINLHAFFEWAIRMKKIKENPVQLEEIPKQELITYDLLSLPQIQAALTVTPKGIFSKTACRNRAIIVLLLQSGVRNAELRSLKPSDLDFERCTITVSHGKGDKRREVAFPALSRQLVKEYIESGVRPAHLTDDDWLFGTDADERGHSTNGRVWHRFSSNGLLSMARRYIARCTGKENGVKVHSLRHAATALWDDLGVPIRTVQQALGHASVSLTEKTYTYVLRKEKNAELINNVLDGALGV